MRLGNGRFESTVFNSRLQPIQIALGTSATNTSLLKLNYDYGTTDNNGNVKSQTVTVPQMSNPLVQNYSYDSLNRITEAKETSNGSQQWIQSFTYDRYGNRRIDSATNKTTSSLVGPNPVISETNNRIVAQQGEQYLYDSTGNLTRDKDGNTFVYDAENKQVTYRQAGSVTDTAYYAYDGNGQRVRKIFNSITTIFIYDASGKLVEEYETTTPPTNGKIQYTTQDTLGSPRVLTDASGQVTSRRDFLPFGEEIASGIGGRNTAQGYGGQDSIRQKFTGYQRDTESGLDFAQARYYSSQLGRFSSADPLMASGRAEMPQSWNRYAYVLNNPLKFNDPTGLSEQGGTMIKHPDNRMVKINTDEILTVYIQTKPANPVNGRGISGEDVFRYDTEVTVTNEKGEVVPSESTLYFFDVRDQRRQNFDLATGEPKTIVEEVDIDYEGVSAPEKRSVTVEVKGEKKDIDYKIQNVGNTVQVVQDSYDNKITIPGVPTFIGVPVSRNKPDPIVESMRPKQPGTTLALNGY
jgi:RHS repeat-associated protein